MGRPAFRTGDDVRAVWCLALIVFAVGSYVVAAHYRHAIGEVQSSTQSLYERTISNERTAAQASSLLRVQKLAIHDLREISLNRPLWATTSQLLPRLETWGGRFAVSVVGVEPDEGPQTPALQRHMLETGLVIRVRGRFENILRFIEQLSHANTPIRAGYTQMELARVPGRSDSPILTATIHATLYRIQLPEDEERFVTAAR